MKEQANCLLRCNALMVVKWKLSQYMCVWKIIYHTTSTKIINVNETFQFQAQPPELHTAQHYLRVKKKKITKTKKAIWCAAERMHWQNAKLLLSLFFSWAPELLVCTCLLLSQTLFWETTTQSGAQESIFGSYKYKQMKNITDVKPHCVGKMHVSENRLLFTKPARVLDPTLGPPPQDTHEVRAAPGKWLKA